MKIYIDYEVEGFGKQTAGPYKDYTEAQEHKRDIAGFEGVSKVEFRQEDDDVNPTQP